MAAVKKIPFERVSALFVGTAFLGGFALFIGLMIQKGWFEPKITYYTHLDNGEGVRVGSPIQMVGVQVGSVQNLELDEQNRIRLSLSILQKFQNRIREDSHVLLSRPFLVGDKVLHLTPGTASHPVLSEGKTLRAEDSLGVMELLNGKKFTPYFQTMEKAAMEMRKLVDLLLKNNASEKLVQSLAGMPEMVQQVSAAAGDLSKLSHQLTDGERLGTLVANLSELSDEFKKVVPSSSHRMVEALDETVVVLKAMQKSFLLRSSAREVREEEEKARTDRLPASETIK